MGFIPRRRIKENLREVEVFLEDRDNTIFKVQDVPDTFVQGRSAFKIFGSEFLKTDVPLKIELLDKAGVPVYTQPVQYGETYPSLPYRYISVEVYPPPVNIPGEAELVILGELNDELVDVEQRFRGAYNVKFSKIVNIDTEATINEQPILFYKKPEITAKEFVTAQKLTSAPGTRFISGSQLGGSVNSDIKGNTFISSSEVDVQTKVNDKSESPSGDLAAQSNLWKYKTGLYKENKVLKRRGLKQEKRSPEKPQMTIRSGEDKFITKMVGSNITIKNITLPTASAVELSGLDPNKVSVEEIYNAFTFPDFEAKVEDIKSDKELVLNKPYAVEFVDPTSTDTTPKKIFTDIGDDNNSTFVDFTASYTDWDVPATSSYRFDSFIDLTIEDMRTFSGDVYRVKVSGGSDSTQGDFPVLLDTVVDAPELLVDTTSPSGVLRSGYFIDQDHIDKYWNTFGGNNNANQLSANYTMSLADGMYLSGSYETYNQVGRVDLDSTYAFTVKKDVAYTLAFTAKGKKATKTSIEDNSYQSAKIFFHLSGSNLKDFSESDIQHKASFGNTITNEFGQPVGLEIEDSDPITVFKDFGIISHTFTPNFKSDRVKNTDTTIQMRIHSGEWIISDLSLRPAASTGFSPDEFQCRIPIPPNTLRPDNFDFLVEYLDINGNTAETITFLDNVPISGSALILEGDDNLLTGSLYMGNASGEGIEAAGANSAFIRSVGYEGFLSASNATGINGGFMMFSGSVLPDSGDDYEGVGLELVANSASFFKFRSNPSILDIRADKFFIGTRETQFISGSDSNIEISSSLFHLDPKNDSLIIGADATINASLAANQIRTPAQIGGVTSTAANASSSIDTQGFARFVSASIGGWVISDGEFISGTGPNSVTMSSEIGLISMGSGSTFNKGDLQGGLRVGFDTDGTFKFAVGSSDSYIHADNSGVSIKSDSFDVTASVAEIDVDVFKLSATNLFISSSGGGFISAGNPRPTGVTGTNKGFYVQGDTGVFLAGNVAGGHILFDGTDVSISSSAFFLGNADNFISGSNTNFELFSSGTTTLSGSAVTIAAPKIFLGKLDSAFVSASEGNIEISSSNFHLQADGDVVMSGQVTADSGEIGGFEIASNQINSTNDNVILKSSGQITASAIQLTGEVNITGGSGKGQLDKLGAETASIKARTASFENSVTSIGAKTSSFAGSITLIGEKTSSLGDNVVKLAIATASLQAKTASFESSITTLGERTASLAGDIITSKADALVTSSLFNANAVESSSKLSAGAISSGSKLTEGAIVSSSFIAQGSRASASLFATAARDSGSLFAASAKASASLFAIDALTSGSQATASLQSGINTLGEKTASLQSGVDTLGSKTASLDSSVTTLGQKTASLDNFATVVGVATASLQAKTGSLATGITNVGASSITSASLFSVAARDSASLFSVAARDSASLFAVGAKASASLFVIATELSASVGLAQVSSSVSGAFTDTSSSIASRQQTDKLATLAKEATFSSSFTLVGAMTASLTEATASAESSLASIGVSTASIAATTASIEVDSGSLAAAIQLTSASLNVLNSDSNIIAEFGANTFVGLQSSEHVQISPSGLDLKDGSTVLGRFASTTTIGDTSTEHVSISGSGLELLDGSTQRFAVNSSGVAIGDNFGVDGSGNVTMAGNVTAAAGSIGGFTLSSTALTSSPSGQGQVTVNESFLRFKANNNSTDRLNLYKITVADDTNDSDAQFFPQGASGATNDVTRFVRIRMGLGEDKGLPTFKSAAADGGNIEFSYNNAFGEPFAVSGKAFPMSESIQISLASGSAASKNSGTNFTYVVNHQQSGDIGINPGAENEIIRIGKVTDTEGDFDNASAGNNREFHYGISGSVATTASFGSVFADYLNGDGSNITGLSSAAISSVSNFGDNNRIVTAAGAAAVNAEANLTFDGSTLTVTGDISVTDDLFVGGGLIDLKNDGSFVSQIKFYCESSNAHAQTLIGAPHAQSATNTLTLPDGSDGVLVSTVSTATLTNKTLTSPDINTPDIDGGTIDNTPIGGNTPAAGAFTTVTTSDVVLSVTGTENAPAFQFASANDGFYHLASGDAGINLLVNNIQEFLFADGGAFHADGEITAFSSTVASDKRLKTNITPITNSLDKIKKLRPVEFDWLVNRDKHEYGLIAQEVEQVVPEMVIENKAIGDTKKFLKDLDGTETFKTVDYSKINVLLIDAIKEQQEQIEELKKEIKEIKNGSS